MVIPNIIMRVILLLTVRINKSNNKKKLSNQIGETKHKAKQQQQQKCTYIFF